MHHTPPQLLDALRARIGVRGSHEGRELELIEVLEHEPALVLRDCGEAHTIQTDMHGEARRMVGKTHTVPVFSEVNDDFHPVLKALFPADAMAELNDILAATRSSPAAD